MKKGIYSKTVIQSLVVALALGSSALVLANPTNTAGDFEGTQVAQATADADNGGVAANENSTVVGINDLLNGSDLSSADTTDTGNTDNSNNTVDSNNSDASTTDSGNYDFNKSWTDSANDNSNTDANKSWTDSANTDNSTNDLSNTDSNKSWEDSANDNSTNDSYKTADSYNTDNSIGIGDISMAIAMSELSGEVTGNYFNAPESAILTTGGNTMGNESMNSAAGITQVSMNTGFQALSQQSVNVQANLNVGQ